MKQIEVDDDVYAHIAQNTQEIGESASTILRRLLGLSSLSAVPHQASGNEDHEFSEALGDTKFLVQTAAVDRFLYFLSVAHNQKKREFEKVLAIQGRDRKYFAKSKDEIEKSGNSTQPRNIPGTEFWVMTNSPTPQKRSVLRDVLKLLGYSELAIKAASAAIR